MSHLSDEIDRIISKLEYLKSYGLPETAERRHEDTRAENTALRSLIETLHLELRDAKVENARLAMTYGRQMSELQSDLRDARIEAGEAYDRLSSDDDPNKSGAV